MLGSQALETAIGLVLMFFVIALAASTIVELWSQFFSKRSKELETVIGQMLAGSADENAVTNALATFKGTSVYTSLTVAAKKAAPSYISSKTFADAIVEGLFKVDGTLKNASAIPAGLKKRLAAIVVEADNDLQGIKAGLEQWFDGTMERMEGAYKRWATVVLFVIGLVIAVSANASAYGTAARLWRQPATRQAVADAAGTVVTKGEAGTQIKSAAGATQSLKELGLPVGWTSATRQQWHGTRILPWNWSGTQSVAVLGWLTTALLVCLGAPFWFDLLTKLVSLRSSGTKPPPASDDPGSATSAIAKPSSGAPAGAVAGIAGALSAAATAVANAAPPVPSLATTAATNLKDALA